MSFLQQDNPSTRPYLLRALHEWCSDNGFTPYMAVRVDASVQVPREFVKNGEIVLNVSVDSTSGLRLGNDFVEFKARFGGVVRDILVPVGQVVAIYARENGQGMAFPAPAQSGLTLLESQPEADFDAGLESDAQEARTPLFAVPSEPQFEALPGDNDGDDEPPPQGSPSGPARRPVLKRVK